MKVPEYTRLVRVVSQPPWPIYRSERSPGFHWIQSWVGPRAGTNTSENRFIFCLPAIEARFLRHLAPSLVTVTVNKGWSFSPEDRWGSQTPYRNNQRVKISYLIRAYTCSTHGKSEKGIDTQFSSVNLKVIQQGHLGGKNKGNESSGFHKG
jgi:hypothetical protein